MPADVEESYQANTVAELRDELAARGLHTSGTKDELVARLEEDDADDEAARADETEESESEEATATRGEVAVREEATATEEVPADPYKRVYSPWELPADPFAAKAFYDANPDAVDPALQLAPDAQAAAEANIQDVVDQYAAVGVVVEDPRLGSGDGGNGGGGNGGGGNGDETTASVTAIDPTTGLKGATVTVTGVALTGTTKVVIDTVCTGLQVVDDTQVTAVIATNARAGTYPVTLTVSGATVTGPDFVIT